MQEDSGSGPSRHSNKDEIWLPVIKSLPRSVVVLLFPAVLIIGVLAYTRETQVSILSNYCYPFTSNVDRFNVCAILTLLYALVYFLCYRSLKHSHVGEFIRNGVWIPLPHGMDRSTNHHMALSFLSLFPSKIFYLVKHNLFTCNLIKFH